MKDYINTMRELKAELEQQRKTICQNFDDRELVWSVATEMQRRMCQVGEELEQRFHLANSRIIRWLETACEICYQAASGQMDVITFCKYMWAHLYDMEHEYEWSVPEGAKSFSIAAIIKNERNILEWIEYHLLVGVEHFYIYDNESTDGLKDKLQPYIDRGVVTYIYFPGKHQQFAAYNHAIEHFKYDTKWLAMIDGDEYLIPMEEGKLLPQIVDEIEEAYRKHPMRIVSNVGAIGASWRVYGTSGHKTRCEGLVIENYKYRAEDDYFQNAHIKSIYNPRMVTDIHNPHCGHFADDFICISEKGSYIPHSYFYDSVCAKLRINHYFAKSEEELVSKNQRGWPDRDLQRDDDTEIFEASVNCNKVFDPIMDRYIAPLKERLGS
jgi:hypothetical protein